MRLIVKGSVPETVTATKQASTTDLSTPARARIAFEQIDKPAARRALVAEQGSRCAYCMRRIDHEAVDHVRHPTLTISHRLPIHVAPGEALTWRNLLGSCDGGRASGRTRSCDVAQGATPLTVDPTNGTSCARLRYETREARRGYFITSDDPALKHDVEHTLALNSGDLPELRREAWDAFLAVLKRRRPNEYGRSARAAFFNDWISNYSAKLPPMLGVIEAKIAEPEARRA